MHGQSRFYLFNCFIKYSSNAHTLLIFDSYRNPFLKHPVIAPTIIGLVNRPAAITALRSEVNFSVT
jgi:hypothetical protein